MASMLHTLLGFLNRVFDKDPHQFLALRVDYSGGMLTWTIADGVLTITSSDTVVNVSVALSGYTLLTLAGYLAGQDGLQISALPSDGSSALSALVLVEGTGTTNQPNGDGIFAYTSLLWAYMGACANELVAVQAAIAAMPLEMSTTTADGEWLDFIGNMFGILRLPGEMDQSYGPRIPAEVVAPLSNGIAIQQAITNSTGQPCTITDVVEYGPAVPEFNAAINFDGSHDFNAAPEAIYCLFDCLVGYNMLNGPDPASFEAQITAQINRLRAAGTYLRNLTLTGSQMNEAVVPPADGIFEGYYGFNNPGGPYTHGASVVPLNGGISPPNTRAVQIALSTSNSVVPTTGWEPTGIIYGNTIWALYYPTPPAAGAYYVWLEVAASGAPGESPGNFTAVSSFTITVG
jgi:hypothetical protein